MPGFFVPQKGLASSSHTTRMNSTSGSSLNQRSARYDGSTLPFTAPLSSRPVHE